MTTATRPQAPLPRDDAVGDVELSVVMPCLNEAQTLEVCITKTFDAIRRMGIVGEVVVADNGSTDGSIEIARRLGARVVPAEQRGYGSALAAGCNAAAGRFTVMGDADDSYDFSEIAPFVERLRAGDDLVMGSRLKGEIRPGAMPWKNRYIGNPALSGILRLLFRTSVSDAHCGLRAFSKEAWNRMDLRTPGMEFASEMVIKAAKLRLRISEVPIVFHPDGRDRPPHLKPWRDGWRHVKLMFMFSPTALFLVPGLGLLVLGSALMLTQLFAPVDGPFRILGLAFDLHWAIVGGLFAIVGYQIVMTHFFARIYSVTHRLREQDAFLARLFRTFTLDRVLVIAVLVTLLGLGLAGVVVTRWLGSDFGALRPRDTRWFILGTTVTALGVQTFFNAFFFSILGDAYKLAPPAAEPSSAAHAASER